jgi:hypothetical protein
MPDTRWPRAVNVLATLGMVSFQVITLTQNIALLSLTDQSLGVFWQQKTAA